MKITQASVNAFLQQNSALILQQFNEITKLGRGAFIIFSEMIIPSEIELPAGNFDGKTTAIFLTRDAIQNLIPDLIPLDTGEALLSMVDRYNPDAQMIFAFGSDDSWLLNTIRMVSPDNN